MTGPATDPTLPRRPGRGLRLALIASLALNLLFVGLLAGGVMTGAQWQAVPSAGPDMRALWRALPEDDRRAMRARFRDDAGEPARAPRAERRAQMAESEAEMLALLRAEDFDAAAFAALLDNRRASMASRAEAAQAAFIARLAELGAAERAAIAERYEAQRSRRFGAR